MQLQELWDLIGLDQELEILLGTVVPADAVLALNRTHLTKQECHFRASRVLMHQKFENGCSLNLT